MKIHSQDEVIAEIKKETGVDIERILPEDSYFLEGFSNWVNKVDTVFESDKEKIMKYIVSNLIYPLDENELHLLEEYKHLAFCGYTNAPLKVYFKSNDTDEFANNILSLNEKDFTRIVIISKLKDDLWDCDRFERRLDA